jgi:hypothetical protein
MEDVYALERERKTTDGFSFSLRSVGEAFTANVD